MQFEKNKIEWLEFELLSKESNLFSACFLRHGGTSSGAYIALNASNSVGDHPDAVKVNRDLIRESADVSALFFAKQEHSDTVIELKSLDQKIGTGDAIITNIADAGICITHADCQAAVFYDPQNRAIGVAHAGWRGLVKNIYRKTIEAMHKAYGTETKNLLVAISPSLGPDHAEFKNYKKEFPQSFWEYQEKPHFFNLWGIAYMLLTNAGVVEKNIEIVRTCTYSHPQDYYSYRRDQICGRHATVVALKK